VSDILDDLENASGPEPETWIGTAVVTNPAAGTFPDGRLTVTVNWQGTPVTCAYLASYTPVVNDLVTFLKSGASFLVLGSPATSS
jgi:hypothetical protein